MYFEDCILALFLFFVLLIVILYFNSRKTSFKPDISANTKDEFLEELKLIKRELLLKPFNVGLYFYLGNCYYRLELYNKAIISYTIFQKLRGEDHYIYFNKALAYKQQKNDEKAYEYFLLTLEHDEYHIYALLELGNIEFQKSNFDKSKEYYLTAYNINSCNQDVLFSLGVLCGQIKEPKESIDYLLRATEIDENAATYYFLGLAYLDIFDYDNSIEVLTNAINLDENYGLAYLKRSIAKLSIGDLSAIEDLEKAELLIPHNPELVILKVHYNQLHAEYTSSLDLYDEILKTNPNDVDSLNGKGLLLGTEGDFDNAILYFEKALSVEPNNRYSLHFKASAKKELGDYDTALEIFLSLYNLYPDDVDANLDIAECYLELKNIDKALEFFTKHKELEGNNMGDCYYGLAICYENLNEPDLAKENFFLAGTYGNITAILMLAKFALLDKRFDDALVYYKQAKTLNPDFKELDEMIKLTIIQSENEKLKDFLSDDNLNNENDKGDEID